MVNLKDKWSNNLVLIDNLINLGKLLQSCLRLEYIGQVLKIDLEFNKEMVEYI